MFRAVQLCSGFCFILRAPFNTLDDDGSAQGRVWVWIGGKSDPNDHAIVKEVRGLVHWMRASWFHLEFKKREKRSSGMQSY